MKSNDYIRFMTEQLVSYMNLLPEEKKERKQKRKTSSQLYSNKWFGILPFAIQSWHHQQKNSRD